MPVATATADPPDEPIGSKVDGRPLAGAIVSPPTRERFDLLGRSVSVEGGHVGEVLRLRVDLCQRLEIRFAPLPQQQPLGSDLLRNAERRDVGDGLVLGEQLGQMRHDAHPRTGGTGRDAL